MVSYAVPNGQLPLKARSPEQLSTHVKAESPTSNQSYNGVKPQWQSHGTMAQGQQGSLGRISSSHRHSPAPGQSSPKLEHQLSRERERDSYEEFAHDRKRSKIHDSVHKISSQMQSQLLSPRGVPGPPGPTLTRDSAVPAPKYSEPHHSGDRNPSRMAAGPHLSPPVSLNPLDEPSPLGLTLRKTPSLLDLISMKLAQGGTGDQGSVNPDPSSAQDTGKNRPSKCLVPTANATAATTAQDKLKASNFPASNLKVGSWERVSVYEGDLVGKCYYAKRKLVWEVLERGLKSKIEIQWSDISAMKASCPENLPGTLEIEVSRPPLFFRETNPQPRKHTLWQATADFTGGQATICKVHSLQFLEGVLNRHIEKLVQCDPRLKALVEGTVPSMPTSDYEHPTSLFDGQHRHQHQHQHQHQHHPPHPHPHQHEHHPQHQHQHQHQHLAAHQAIGHQSGTHDANTNQQPFVLPHMCVLPGNTTPVTSAGIISDSKPEVRLMKMQSNNLASPSSVMDTRGSDESGTSDTEDSRIPDDFGEYAASFLGATGLLDTKPSCHNLFMIGPNTCSQGRTVLDELAHTLLGDTVSSLSNDHTMMLASRVGHMSAALTEDFQIPHPGSHNFLEGLGLGFDSNNNLYPFGSFHVKSELGQHDDQLDLLVASSGNNAMNGRVTHMDPSLTSLMSCFSKHGPASDLLMNLPRVASLPQLFETASQGPLGRYDQPLMRQSYLGSEKLR